MSFIIKKTDGPGRIGELEIEKQKITTPNISFVNTNRFRPPDFAELIISKDNCKTKKACIGFSDYFIYPKDLDIVSKNIDKKGNYCIIPANKNLIDKYLKNNSTSIFIIADAYQSFQKPKEFLEFIVALREKIGYEKAIYVPRIGNPSSISLLTYLGVDLFDSASAIIAARKNILFFEDGEYDKNELGELSCNCPVCTNIKSKPSEMSFEEILNHNYNELFKEIKKVRNAIHSEHLRDLVETRVKSDPNLTTILRNLDNLKYEFLEKSTPTNKNKKILATTKESLFRPEIKRFQQRVINRYKKPDVCKVLLLLPCSARKPYSFSKSHKLFRDKILSSKNPHIIHEVIITSPIGLVPRELELVYPAANYDIPVTGIWDEDEKKMIKSILSEYLKKNKYEKIISHLPESLMEFLDDILKGCLKTCAGNPTSNDSLEKLSKTLNKEINSYEKVKSSEKRLEEMYNLASYQFGKEAAKKLLKKCNIKGKYPYSKIFDKGSQIGMLTKKRGFISLTLNGAKRLRDTKSYWVKIYDDFEVIGSIFAPGIFDSDENIRIGDEVIVLKNNKIVGVGVAQMNGEQMKNSTYGEAVKIRHKI